MIIQPCALYILQLHVLMLMELDRGEPWMLITYNVTIIITTTNRKSFVMTNLRVINVAIPLNAHHGLYVHVQP